MYRLVLAWGTFAEHPIVLATSRDGRRKAPTRPLTVLRTNPKAVVSHAAGVEETVLGHNEHGVVVFTRRRPTAGRTVSLRDVLGCRSAADAVRAIERAVAGSGTTGDLLVCDANTALSIETGEEMAVNTLTPGIHVFVGKDPGARSRNAPEDRSGADHGDRAAGTTDDGIDSMADPRGRPGPPSTAGAPVPRPETARWLYEHLRPKPGERALEWCHRAQKALANHEHGVCVHGLSGTVRRPAETRHRSDRNGSGERPASADSGPARIETRSAASLVVDRSGALTYTYADGPPCSTPFRSVNPLG